MRSDVEVSMNPGSRVRAGKSAHRLRRSFLEPCQQFGGDESCVTVHGHVGAVVLAERREIVVDLYDLRAGEQSGGAASGCG